jgi:hypothetical protein
MPLRFTRPLRALLPLFLATVFFSACGTDPVISTQDIGNAIWRNNSSMLVFAEKRDFVSTGAFIYKLYEAGADGQLGRSLAVEETSESVPFIAVSADGNTAITLLASDLYRMDIPSGTKTQLTTNVTKVYAVSPDLKYVLLTHAGLFQPIKTVSLLDISGSPRSVNEWQIKGLLVSQGFWLKGDQIALNLDTASSPFLAIYDTTGAVLKTYPKVQTPARSSAYVPDADLLFVKSFDGLEEINVVTGARTSIADSYVNLDARGNTLAYIERQNDVNKIFIRNITTGETVETNATAFRFVILSPDATKLAYLVESRDFYTELKVIPVTTP